MILYEIYDEDTNEVSPIGRGLPFEECLNEFTEHLFGGNSAEIPEAVKLRELSHYHFEIRPMTDVFKNFGQW